MDPISDKPLRFLSFADDKEDAEKEAKLKEAAKKIEEAISREKSITELIDYVGPTEDVVVDAANDTRPLYVRLQEQKNKKKEVEEESQKPSNFVSVLDEEEVDYLNEVERKRREEELKKRLEVYDALESKKRLDEQRALVEEQRRKETLLGSTLNRKESQIKSRLSSMIKMKPKSKSPGTKGQTSTGGNDKDKRIDDPDSDQMKAEPNHANNDTAGGKPEKDCSDQEKEGTTNTNNTKSDDDVKKLDESDECLCSKGLMKCIGVLPSLPQAANKRDSSGESDQSDDDLERRLVPHIRKRKKRS